jgi:hypothetical protein
LRAFRDGRSDRRHQIKESDRLTEGVREREKESEGRAGERMKDIIGET